MQQQEVSSQNSTIPTFLMTQGKLMSQMVAYIWRWADCETDERRKYARELKACFDRTHSRMSQKSKHEVSQASYELEILLTVDARKYLLEKEQDNQEKLKDYTKDEKQAAELLINVFGKERVRNLTNYLSPIFQREAVDMRDDNGNDNLFPVYQFHINTNSFIGTLEDPSLEQRLAFRYMVSYPPAPQLSEATLTNTVLDKWIENTDKTVFRPENPYIPTSTS